MKSRKKRIIVSVTNDLTTDQRVDRVCSSLYRMGFDVLLVGRRRKESLPLRPRSYRTKRMWLLFSKGPLFYAEYNLRLFFFLLFSNVTAVVSNDLDTLPANRLAAMIRNLHHVHDCHEYFRGMPELNGRERVKGIWKWIEDRIFPYLMNVYAVNGSVARLYHEEYGNHVRIIRNVPFRKKGMTDDKKTLLGIPADKKIILYQGAVNIHRGLEEAIEAMTKMTTPAILVILGTGDLYPDLVKKVRELNLTNRVLLPGVIPLEDLYAYTCMGDIGLSIEKDVCLNYHFSLPNKFLDYIQARIPVLVSPFPEMKAIVETYQIGEMIDSHDRDDLAAKFDTMLGNPQKLGFYRKNLEKAAAELCWENEQPELIRIFEPYA